ncbi:hypothetical protein JS541_09865 [Bifidobacterium sp. SO1]|nr:hypothetical protein [Bifidobacterium sp. SO1]
MADDYDKRLHEAQTQGQLVLLPEADPNDLDSYMAWPPQYKPSIDYCSHGDLTWPGVNTGMTYHDRGDGMWEPCSDDPDYETYVKEHGDRLFPANF